MSELKNLYRFLARSGWVEERQSNERVVALNSPVSEDGDFVTVLLPQSEEFADSGRRLNEALSSVAAYLKMSSAILSRRLKAWDRDILRTRLFDRLVDTNAIPLRLASLVIDDLRSFVGYAAYAQQAPRPFFPRSGAVSAEFTEHCYFGHTFHGSFGLTIECPLPMVGQMAIAEEFKDPPFQRLVMQRIAHGYLQIQRAAKADDPTLLIHDYESGMNANMLRSLTQVYERLDRLSVEYAIEWAPELTPRKDLIQGIAVRFDGRAHEVASYAAAQLEAEDAPAETVVVSHVVSLKSEMPLDDGVQDQFDHVITLDWEKEAGIPVRIRVALPREEYRKACDAHKNGRKIQVTGVPVKRGKFWTLEKPSEVTFVT
jgi:hypothetical protein